MQVHKFACVCLFTAESTTDNVRKKMEDYWKQYKANLESMMLSQDARKLDDLEKLEILSYLPDIQGKSVLELGAGIGSVFRSVGIFLAFFLLAKSSTSLVDLEH